MRYTEIRTTMFINIFETLHHLFFLFAVLNLYIYIYFNEMGRVRA